MDRVKALLEDRRFVSTAGGTLFLAGLYYAYLKKNPRKIRRNFPPNVVGLHQIGRGLYAPSMSPFPLKLETYMRMAKIPYENDHRGGFSPKGKTPWITYNGEDVSDSQFCIEFLNDKFNVDLNKHLSEAQKATAHAFQRMVEENTYWTGVMWRFVYNKDDDLLKTAFKLSSITLWYIRRHFAKMAHAQGMGRHSMEEVYHIGELDMEAVSNFLGDKKFLMGDEPCQADPAIFASLAQAKFHSPGSPMEQIMKEKYANLDSYLERMKERFWPDWDDCITWGGTRRPKL